MIQSIALNKNKYKVALHIIINYKAKNFSLFILGVQQADVFIIAIIGIQQQSEKIIKTHYVGFFHIYLSKAVNNTVIQARLISIILQTIVDQKLKQEQVTINQVKNYTANI